MGNPTQSQDFTPPPHGIFFITVCFKGVVDLTLLKGKEVQRLTMNEIECTVEAFGCTPHTWGCGHGRMS